VLHLPAGRQKLEQSNEQLMLADWTWGKETTRTLVLAGFGEESSM
jgi:hypothetical protein